MKEDDGWVTWEILRSSRGWLHPVWGCAAAERPVLLHVMPLAPTLAAGWLSWSPSFPCDCKSKGRARKV